MCIRDRVWIFNREADVLDVGAQYLSIAAFSYPAIALNYVFMGVLRSTERVKLPLYATLVTTLLNAGLDYAFIFGFGLDVYKRQVRECRICAKKIAP